MRVGVFFLNLTPSVNCRGPRIPAPSKKITFWCGMYAGNIIDSSLFQLNYKLHCLSKDDLGFS